jgi:hypothetical protein
MADHLRDQILASLKTAITGLTTTGANVFADRTDELQANEVPGLTLNQGGAETPEYKSTGYPRTIIATFDVEISAYDQRTRAQADARQRCNTIDKEVQAAVAAWAHTSTLITDMQRGQTDFDLSTESDKTAAMVRMRYFLQYVYKENAPDVLN